jgi:hypothetical protein
MSQAAPEPGQEPTSEHQRLADARERGVPWRRWGPYLSERQWGTVREDYSADGDAWGAFDREQAPRRAYRWGEDGIAGLSDDRQHLCFAVALWNGADSVLKERLFGLTNAEGNHGEDAKEYWFHLDNLPTHAYMKTLYKYPQRAFPYTQLVEENRRRGRDQPEYELLDTGIFDDDRYFDIFVEYAKAGPDDVLIRIKAVNRGPDPAPLHLLPTLWFRNDWSWKPDKPRPRIDIHRDGVLQARHRKLGEMWLYHQPCDELLFTENESNGPRLWGTAGSGFYKDAFDDRVVHGRGDATKPQRCGSKASPYAQRLIAAGETWVVKLRLASDGDLADALGAAFDGVFEQRRAEADAFYRRITPFEMPDDLRLVQRQAFAGLLWSKQWYHYDVRRWLQGDPVSPPPPQQRRDGRNPGWMHFDAADVISMPDKWEYPWFAAWDLAFHCVAFALIDPDFAKQQLLLLTREWYMHPNGQLPAYEWNFGDANPPVHAWAAIRVYQIEQKATGRGDRLFLERIFQKLLINFTWWVNRKDEQGRNLFEGGFLGLDNIGAFDRTRGLPGGGRLEQADGTAWMAMYCLNLLAIALELAADDPAYEDVATKFFEHFVYIGEAMNRLGGSADGLWHDGPGWYFDVLRLPDGRRQPMSAFTIAGLVPVLAVAVVDPAKLKGFPDFESRRAWFSEHRPEMLRHITDLAHRGIDDRVRLALVDSHKLQRLLQRVADPAQMMSPHGLRSVSRQHLEQPFVLEIDGARFTLDYEPGESTSGMFGGNSNWRGPVWLPLNFLLIEALQKHHWFLGDDFRVPSPGGGAPCTLWQFSSELSRRLIGLFARGPDGRRPVHGVYAKFHHDPHWRDLIPFNEYFHGETGAGLGASHQTGWTALVAKLIQQHAEYTLQGRPHDAGSEFAFRGRSEP